MIERYSDHAANERTFLAWVRTSIAIMAFGFLEAVSKGVEWLVST
jgi:putative membrane protein